MTGKERKPQTPNPQRAERVRQRTDYQDGSWPSGILRGERQKYERLPKERPPENFGFPVVAVEKPV